MITFFIIFIVVCIIFPISSPKRRKSNYLPYDGLPNFRKQELLQLHGDITKMNQKVYTANKNLSDLRFKNHMFLQD